MGVGPGVVENILVVDDDDRTVAALARSFGSRHAVLTATDAATGIALARTHRPDVAIVDLRLGPVSGLDVVRAIRDDAPDARIVVLSAYLSIDVTVVAVKAGADIVMTKPATASEILLRARRGGDEHAVPVHTPSLAEVEAEHIARVLNDCDGNISEAARRLGIYRSSLQRKLKKAARLR